MIEMDFRGFLNEMALKKMAAKFAPEGELTSYSRADRASIQSEGTRKKLERWFAQTTGIDWNIAFIDNDGQLPSYSWKSIHRMLQRDFGMETETAVNVLFLGNGADPMTPWMIAHNVGHGILPITQNTIATSSLGIDDPMKGMLTDQYRKLIAQMIGMAQDLGSKQGTIPKKEGEDDHVYGMRAASHMLPFRSARNAVAGTMDQDKIQARNDRLAERGRRPQTPFTQMIPLNQNEFAYEIIAHYIQNGGIDLKEVEQLPGFPVATYKRSLEWAISQAMKIHVGHIIAPR